MVTGQLYLHTAYHIHINNNPTGKHPTVCVLMAGIFNKGPHKRRFAFAWDIEKKLNDSNELYDNLNLPVNLLPQKFAFFSCLNCGIQEFRNVLSKHWVYGQVRWQIHFYFRLINKTLEKREKSTLCKIFGLCTKSKTVCRPLTLICKYRKSGGMRIFKNSYFWVQLKFIKKSKSHSGWLD